MENNSLLVLVGEQLSAVTFVQDYLQLDFDGNQLTCYVWPQIETDSKIFFSSDSVYKNKLCEMISKVVKDVKIDDNYLSVIFQSDDQITLSLSTLGDNFDREKGFFVDLQGSVTVFE